jgi:hypothetical protein
MYKRLLSVAAAAAGAILVVAPALPASASGSPVLTVGSTSGTAVAVGDTLTASQESGTDVTIPTTSGGSTGITCTAASLTASVTANPDSSGNADESVTGLTTTGCTSNITGVTGVNSVTLNNLPYNASVAPGGNLTVTAGSAGAIQSTVSLKTVLGTITCVYKLTNTFVAVVHNGNNTIVVVTIEFTLVSGPAVCPKNGFLSVTLGPVIDTTQGNQKVFAAGAPN